MRKVFRLKGIASTIAALATVPVILVALAGPQAILPRSIAERIADGLFLIVLVWLCLCALFTRVVATDDAIERYDCFNRLCYRLRYDLVTLYSFNGIRWYLRAGPGRFHLPFIDFDDFHRLILEKAPAALRARRWRCGQLPPAGDFTDLCLFDFGSWVSRLAGLTIASALVWLINRNPTPIYMMAGWFVGGSVEMLKLFGGLSLTKHGISSDYPWRRRSIGWNEIVAIFCEGKGRHRSFTVVSKIASIRIPDHIAIQFEPMQKVFYNLPDGTLCVNFDINYKRGYRRRKKRLLPSFRRIVHTEAAFEF